MKAIISGLRYDTDKAVLIGESGGGSGRGDFHWWEAGLYRTPRAGRYFIAGEGGAMTMFGEKAGQNEWRGGEKILPLSVEDAFAWAQEHLPPATVEQHFADLIEEA